LNKLSSNGVLLEEYFVSPPPATPSMNRISSLMSTYDHQITNEDINVNHFEPFSSQNYQIKQLHDSTLVEETAHSFSNSFPFLLYIELDNGMDPSMQTLDDEIGNVLSYYAAKSNVDVWQNTLLIVSSDYNTDSDAKSFALLSGPRIPSKKRGTTYSNKVYSVDWIATICKACNADTMDGFDMWDSIIYNKLSPRTTTNNNIERNNEMNEQQRHKNVITQDIKI